MLLQHGCSSYTVTLTTVSSAMNKPKDLRCLQKYRAKEGWGNNSSEEDAETNKLILLFKASGIMLMKMKATIPIIIDTKQIKTGLELAANFDDPDDVPRLELKDKDEIVVASGQHCLCTCNRCSPLPNTGNVKESILIGATVKAGS
ncbi:uncharacterized protein EDB91DRAFT_1076290 [Suillus paluster]|uniref:uncharacterized protein n=1 Tax=Suillus paluster TaxID=48578 RepID=UPI001B86FE8C|nr:uncharacterized protein EDB91DRAFT_1076290 [Suillus paluster]KAG1756189.1 hypothetical protein EDB91DRAFT_1076290 [Suillus paluster]